MEAEKRMSFSLVYIVFLIATAISINAYYPALVNDYVINGDIAQHVYWMEQFRDQELFRNDLLTEFAKTIQPWGFIEVYRLGSNFADPLWISKILPILMFVLSSVYVFKLVQIFAGSFTGFLAACLFMTMPIFLDTMSSGTARTFGLPFLIMFLHYLVKKDHAKASFVLMLQPLFYPVVFLISSLTYLLTFIELRTWRNLLNQQCIAKVIGFALAGIIGVATLAAKQVLDHKPSLGITVTRNEMNGRPEFSSAGRFQIVPTDSLVRSMIWISTVPIIGFIVESPLYLSIRKAKPAFVNPELVSLIMLPVIVVVLLFLVREVKAGSLSIPPELCYLVIASAVMYKIADWVLFRLYLPSRYLQYSIPVVGLIILSLTIGRLIASVKQLRTRRILKVAAIAFLLLHFSINRGIGLSDKSDNRELYTYLSTLPKNTLIAAHPYLADYIPTFSKRKVFINFELSHTWADKYWLTVKARTFDFFDAYYTENPATVTAFCKKYHIDYLIIDKRHFTKEFLQNKKIYFEPFDSYVKNMTHGRNRYALLEWASRSRQFNNGNIFVVPVSELTPS
jgi:hypothetical protein